MHAPACNLCVCVVQGFAVIPLVHGQIGPPQWSGLYQYASALQQPAYASQVVEHCSQHRQELVQASLPSLAARPRLDGDAAALLLQQGVEACHSLEQTYAWAPTTTAAREQSVKELSEWLAQLPAAYGLHLGNVSPEVLGAYVTQHWLPSHAGTILPNGDKLAAPASLSAMLSHLSTHFQRLGRRGHYGLVQPHMGNPVDSFLVEHLEKAHSRRAWALGYEEGSAVPMSKEKLEKLIDLLDEDSRTAKGDHEVLVLQRDAVAFLYAWECGQRGKEVGQLRVANVQDVHGQPALPLANDSPATAVEYIVAPSGTKTRKRQRAGILPVVLDPTRPMSFYLIRRLDLMMQIAAAGKQPITGFLFRVTSGRSFLERGMTSGKDLPVCCLETISRSREIDLMHEVQDIQRFGMKLNMLDVVVFLPA